MKIKLLIIVVALIFATAYIGFQTGKDSIGTVKSGRLIWRGNPNIAQVALTFDDGPSNKYTPQILDILKEHNIKATFFVVGDQIKANKAALVRTAKEGHEFGNHTYYHIGGKITKIKKIRNNMIWTNTLVKRFTGKEVKYFRPPYGYINWRFLKESEKLNYDTVMWSVDAGEWGKQTKESLVKRVLDNTENGTIIVLHDGGPNRDTVIESLPAIIKGLKEKKLKFVTISDLVRNLD